MLDLYTHSTPNGYKISIALEELGLDYTAHKVDISAGEQFAPEMLSRNPNARIPILVDNSTGITVYESSAILLYLAEKSGRLFPSRDEQTAYWDAHQRLIFASASVGPMFGQRMHFSYLAPETVPYSITRYENECARLQNVLNTMLEGHTYFTGNDFSIVDIAMFGWVHVAQMVGYLPDDGTPALNAWYSRVLERPGVQRGLAVPETKDTTHMPPRKSA